MPLKSKEDRVKESITILKKMLELGIGKDDVAFVELKTRMTEWIKDGFAWAGKIPFPSVRRSAVVILPSRASGTASVDFKAVQK